MSFATIIADLKSFASKIESAFKKLFGDAPAWIAIAQGVITYLGPIAVTITGLINPALGTEASTIIANIKSKLATASALTSTLASATDVAAVLTDIQNDLPQLLAALQVSNPELVSKVTTYTSIFDTEIEALLAALPATPATT